MKIINNKRFRSIAFSVIIITAMIIPISIKEASALSVTTITGLPFSPGQAGAIDQSLGKVFIVQAGGGASVLVFSDSSKTFLTGFTTAGINNNIVSDELHDRVAVVSGTGFRLYSAVNYALISTVTVGSSAVQVTCSDNTNAYLFTGAGDSKFYVINWNSLTVTQTITEVTLNVNIVDACVSDGSYVYAFADTGLAKEAIKIRISDWTVVNSFEGGATSYTGGRAAIITNAGDLWVPNQSNAAIEKFDSNLNHIYPLGVGTTPRSIAFNTGTNHAFVTNAGSNTVSVVDTTVDSVVNTQAVGTTPYGIVQFGADTWVANSGTTSVTIITDGASGGGIDCNLPANADILTCYLQNQTGGVFGGAGGIISTGMFNVFKNSGLISGTDTNVKTNGVGYMLVAIAMGVMVSMFFIATKGNMTEIPTFVWFISSIAVIGGMTAIGFVDPTFLIISIIVIVAFAVSKVSKNLFAGGSFGSQGFAGE